MQTLAKKRKKMSKEDMTPVLQDMDMHIINLEQRRFEIAIQLGDYDLMHEAHVKRDEWIQSFNSEYGRLPEQDRSSRKWS
jgi:hypothetical protein